MRRWCLWLFACAGCAIDPLPSAGEVVLEIDTDLPVPGYANRLRIDVYRQDGSWLETRDVLAPDPSSWPLSFSVVNREDEPRVALVRLRAYADGKVRDYQGERWQPWDGTPPPCEARAKPTDDEARLPSSEPTPALAVDRLVALTIEPHVVQRSRVTLRGACLGKMARLAADCSSRPALESATTCVDDPGAALPPPAAAEEIEPSSIVGSFPGNDPCPGPASAEAPVVCVPGGLFVFGDADESAYAEIATVPERAVVISTFFVDRFEVSVGEVRAALLEGLTLPELYANDGPLSVDDDEGAACTFTSRAAERENHPINCLPRADAERYCQWRGGQLATEAQYEYMAARAGKLAKTRFAWGDEAPVCGEVIFGRAVDPGSSECLITGQGPASAGAGAMDVTPLGLRDLSASLSEWTRDGYAPYDDPCWTAAPLRDPLCEGSDPTARGGAYDSYADDLAIALRGYFDHPGRAAFVGFRCVYTDAP